MAKISILKEEPHYLVVDKPAGLFSQAPPDVPCLQRQLAEELKQRDAHQGVPFIGMPHRLDRATSGAMLIARNQRSLKRFGQQFQSRKIGKFYLAVVEGNLPQQDSQECFDWTDFVRKIENEPKAEITTPELGKEARLTVRVLSRCDADANWPALTLMLVQLHTGRMHQIRLQAAHRALPVVGDKLYGSQLAFGAHPADSREATFALHALRIEFRHPQTAKLTSGTAPVPQTWQSLPQKIQRAVEASIECSQQNESTALPLGEF